MPSSTSSSESNVDRPAASLGRWLVLGILGGALLLGGYEAVWRARGFSPTLQDSAERWAKMRVRADDAGESALALAGSSRFQLGVDPAVLAAAFPQRAVANLVIDGSPSLPVLRDLALDPEFKGVVLCEVTPTSFFAPPARRMAGRGTEWANYTKSRAAIAGLESSLRGVFQQWLAILQPGLNPREVLERVAKRRGAPQPDYAPLREDRFREGSFAGLDLDTMRRHWAEGFAERASPLDDAGLASLLDEVGAWVNAIRGRGGDVIFVRMISSEPVLAIEEKALPSARYWGKLAAQPATKSLHYEELEGIADLSCPDGSHLDRMGARRFSVALASELKKRGWL